MQFIQTDLEIFLSHLSKLDASTKPLWGKMSAQRMVEHLTDSIRMSVGEEKYPLLIPEEKIEKMKAVLASDTPMPKEFNVPFAPEEYELRNEEIELAVDEFAENWIAYEEYYESNVGSENLHPFYGKLNKEGWDRLHSKHFTHHFEQFGLM